jgi:hypothetical protein
MATLHNEIKHEKQQDKPPASRKDKKKKETHIGNTRKEKHEVRTSETSVYSKETTRGYIPEDLPP